MYLLDTNILSELIKRKPNSNFLQKLKEVPPDLLYTTVISVMELRAGCEKRTDKDIFWKRIEKEILYEKFALFQQKIFDFFDNCLKHNPQLRTLTKASTYLCR